MKFEKVGKSFFENDSRKNGFIQWEEGYENIKIPERHTEYSAGYDFSTPYDIVIYPDDRITVPTGIKAKMDPGEVLIMAIRSSVGIKDGVTFSNCIGVIDMDYYGNENNDGDIHLALWNTTGYAVKYKAGTRLAQGFFIKFDVTENDKAKGKRTGGMGSSGK